MKNVAAKAPSDHLTVGQCLRAPQPFTVTGDAIREFARIAHDSHPAHRSDTEAGRFGFDRLVAPPTFAGLALVAAHRDILGAVADRVGTLQVLHTRQSLRIGRLLRAGDVVTTDVCIDSIRRQQDFTAVDVGITLSDTSGRTVQTGSSSIMIRLPGNRTALSEIPTWLVGHSGIEPTISARTWWATNLRSSYQRAPGRDRLSLQPGYTMPVAQIPIRPDDIGAFERLSGIAPQHLPGSCSMMYAGAAPGLLRMALAGGYLTDVLGTPAALRSYSTEFSNFRTPAGHTTQECVELTATVTMADRRHSAAAMAITGRCAGRMLFSSARAEVNMPEMVRRTAVA